MNTSAPTNASSITPSSGTGTPKLTQAEHDLLKAHRGCFCCHLFYVGHLAGDCTLGLKEHPLPEACRNVTLANALKAKATFKKKQSTNMVAAVFNIGSDDETEEYVPHSLSLPNHLWWTCCIGAPATCAPTLIRALIDHESTPVLISSNFADVMCLP